MGLVVPFKPSRLVLVPVPSETCGKFPDGVPYHIFAPGTQPDEPCLCRRSRYDPTHPAALLASRE